MISTNDPQILKLEKAARNILEFNLKVCKLNQTLSKTTIYTSSNRRIYPFQRVEDSCIHVIINSHFDLALAKKEFESIFLTQTKEGMIRRINFWSGNYPFLSNRVKTMYELQAFSSLTIMPLLAQALKAIYNKNYERTFLQDNIQKTKNFYDYLTNFRVISKEENYLLNIIHPWEDVIEDTMIYKEYFNSGTKDQSTTKLISESYIQILDCVEKSNSNVSEIRKNKGFLYQDLIFNSLFIQGYRDLAFLFNELKNDMEKQDCLFKATKIENSLLKKCWNADLEIFLGIHDPSCSKKKIKTISSLIPLILDGLPLNKATCLVEDHLLNPKEFWTKNPVPQISMDEKSTISSNQDSWKNSSRMITNWLIIKGLLKHGFINIAQELLEKTLNMIKRNGFRETYHCQEDKGFGARYFTPSTIIVDLLSYSNEDSNESDFLMNKEWTRIKRLPDF